MTPADISASAEYPAELRTFTRQRQDRLYIPLARSKPPLIAWGPHVAAAIGIILLACLAFPAAQILVDILRW